MLVKMCLSISVCFQRENEPVSASWSWSIGLVNSQSAFSRYLEPKVSRVMLILNYKPKLWPTLYPFREWYEIHSMNIGDTRHRTKRHQKIWNKLYQHKHSQTIAAPNSERTNLSPFTKGCREEGASLRISKFFLGLSLQHYAYSRIHVHCPHRGTVLCPLTQKTNLRR